MSDSEHSIMKSEKSAFLQQTKGLNTYAGENINITYQKMQWLVDPSVDFITGTVFTIFKTTQDNITSISFDMADNLSVGDIHYHGQSLGYLHTGDIITITLPASITINTTDSISILYSGTPDPLGTGSFVQSNHNGTPIIWTLSEPYGAKVWWPCKQDLSDKIDSVDIYVTAPAQYKTASNGILVSEQISGTQKIAHWKHRHPVAAYLIAFAVTDYSVYSDYVSLTNGDSVQVLNYVYPENLTNAQLSTLDVIPVMQLYDSIFMNYPFADEKYGHAQFGQGGGMEHQTMTFATNFDHELIAHELAHQWFGDYITCKSWHEIWLNEGFAVYLVGLTYEHLFNSSYWMPWKTMQIDDITSQPDGSVYVADTANVDRLFDQRLTYHKAGMLLHMLRWELGDLAFFNALRSYLQDPSLVNGFATTNDLRSHLEFEKDTSLTEFFNDWYYGEGYPLYTIDWTQSVTGNINIKIDQQTTNSSVEFFEMTVPLEFKGNGQDTIIRFKNTYSGEEYNIHLEFPVSDVVFDPQKWLITKNPVINEVQRINQLDSLVIYPNPAMSTLIIYGANELVIKEIEMYDILGRKRMDTSRIDSSPVKINIRDLPEGIYYLKMSGKSIYMRSFIKI